MTDRVSLEERIESAAQADGDLAECVKTDISFYALAKNYAVDTSASLIFYTPVFTLIEYGIAGMGSKEVLKSRLIGTAIGLLTARPYGKYREWWSEKTHTYHDSSSTRKLFSEAIGATIWTLPLYAATLALVGASPSQVAFALPSGLLAAAVCSRPYGYFMDKWRKLWGTKPTLEK